DWLKQRYHTRAALDSAWRATPYAAAENGLDATESWETATILPPGIRGVPADQDTRVGDYLRWAASLLTRVNARVGEAIKTVSPRSLLLQQPLAETHQWSREALPLDLQALMQSHPACVDVVATHYSQGGRQDWLANGVGAPHLDSETACNGRPADFIRHHARNGGACLWCFGERGFGAVRPDGWWERSHDNQGRLIHSWIDWIAQVADFQRDAWNTRHPQVLLVANTRRFALGNPDYFGAARLLEQLGVEFDVIASQALLEHPEALRRYHAVVAGTSYADLDTLKLLADSHLPVLYVGPLSADDQARFAAQPVARFFMDRKLFLKSLPALKSATGSAPTGLDLAGNWRFHTDPNDTGTKDGWQQPSLDESAWDEQPVPTYWENINVLGKARDYDGVAWYRKRFTIPAEWRGSTLALEIGAVDDFDEAYLNGVKIGATGAETPAYWMARRLYRLPVEAIRFGQENVLAIRVTDNGGNGGIWKGPVRLTRTVQIPYQITADLGLLRRGEQGAASGVDGLPQSLVSGQILARFSGEDAPVAALRQGTSWLWLADDTLAAESPVHQKLLAAFLQASSVGCRPTPPVWAEKAQVWHYDGYYTVSQTADGKLDLPLATHCALRPLYGATAQQIRADGTSLLPLEGKYGQGAAVLRETPLQVLPRSGSITLTAVRDYDFRSQGRVVTLETEGSAAMLTWRGPAATLNVDGKRCVWKQKGAQREAALPAGKHRIRIEVGERIPGLKSGNKSRSENFYRS
ncbi:MAG TPA: beta galactosidase jelly roll domain-containing protein, partial [Armatimonadota bacterium]|nr:beta galactosidase jelly roll domain-containing protein [Armatimonadota bacterium]